VGLVDAEVLSRKIDPLRAARRDVVDPEVFGAEAVASVRDLVAVRRNGRIAVEDVSRVERLLEAGRSASVGLQRETRPELPAIAMTRWATSAVLRILTASRPAIRTMP